MHNRIKIPRLEKTSSYSSCHWILTSVNEFCKLFKSTNIIDYLAHTTHKIPTYVKTKY